MYILWKINNQSRNSHISLSRSLSLFLSLSLSLFAKKDTNLLPRYAKSLCLLKKQKKESKPTERERERERKKVQIAKQKKVLPSQ